MDHIVNIGKIVHYRPAGASECRAAIVTAVSEAGDYLHPVVNAMTFTGDGEQIPVRDQAYQDPHRDAEGWHWAGACA